MIDTKGSQLAALRFTVTDAIGCRVASSRQVHSHRFMVVISPTNPGF
jgi:hypothetical protein